MTTASESRTVASLVEAVGDARVLCGDPQRPVHRVRLDSREIAPGDLFVAVRGTEQDGLKFVGNALERGAHAVAVEEDQASAMVDRNPETVVIVCENARRFVAAAAGEVAGHPSSRVVLVAVTGTSGKTTTAWILDQIFQAAGFSTGLIGTIEYRFGDHAEPAPLTTPDAVHLQGLLRRMVDAGVTHVVMEASSHALALDRLFAVSCDAGIYTNLKRDHLDFHRDLASYAAAKARLFREILPASGKTSYAILNAEDDEGRKLAGEISVPCVSFGDGGEVRAEKVQSDLDGMRGSLLLGDETHSFESPLVGAPHLDNILAAASAAWKLGIAGADIVRGIAACDGVPGRLEPIRAGQSFGVIVDYAHKPDALERTLASLRGLTRGRLIVVFGCGGDRDVGKRRIMGEIAGRLADRVILTSDNPRTEDPGGILDEIESGVRQTESQRVASSAFGSQSAGREYTVEPDRRLAIRRSVEIARSGDLVLIAGKGHEDYQIIGTEKVHLDDREEVRRALAVAA